MDFKEKGLRSKKETLLMIGGGIAVGLLGLITFKLGHDLAKAEFNSGVAMLCTVDPEIDSRMIKAAETLKNKWDKIEKR